MKIFKTKNSAKSLVKREGLHLMNYDIQPHCSNKGTGFSILFYVHDLEDKHEIESRGFMASIDKEKAA